MPYPREKILPMPWLDLKVNFGDAFQVYGMNTDDHLATCTESWITGMWSTSHVVDWSANIEYIGISFKPGGAYPFLQIPLSELHNEVVPLDRVWGIFATEIRERLYNASTISDRFALMQELLLARLGEIPDGLKGIRYAVEKIAQCHGAVSIHALSDDMGISHKHLIAQFKRLIGGTPKEVARLYRFKHILFSIDPEPAVDWTQVAHQFFYYDQSHFIKDFEAFTGHSPASYLRLRQQVQAENPQRALFFRLLPLG